MVKNSPVMQGPWVQYLGWEDSLEKATATHSSILAWRIPWTEEPGGLQSMGLQRVGHDWGLSLAFTFHVHWVGMPSNHLILCHPLHFLPSIFPSISVFCNELVHWNYSAIVQLKFLKFKYIDMLMLYVFFICIEVDMQILLQYILIGKESYKIPYKINPIYENIKFLE